VWWRRDSTTSGLPEAMYKATAQPGPGGAAGGAGAQGDGGSAGDQTQQKPKDNVVDAEFVDVDDKTKK
jgi:hypothetical protein